MYNIAICDDDKNFIAYLKRMILYAGEKKNLDYRIYEFYSGEELTMKLEGNIHYDLLILDMQLGGIDGDETARVFRMEFPNSVLAFCSGVRQPTIESFKATPFRYIDKKSDDKEIIETIKEILDEVERIAENPYIIAHYRSIERKIQLRSILYIQRSKRGGEVILCSNSREAQFDEKMLVSSKPEELAKELSACGFALAQKSYLVNMDHVNKLGAEDIVLDNGEIIKMSKSCQKSFKESFAKRFSNKYS